MSTPIEDEARTDKPEGTSSCSSPTCSCNTGGTSKKAKVAVCLLVALAAVAVVLLNTAGKTPAAAAPDAFAMPAAAAPSVAVTPEPATKTAAKPQPAAVWGPTLSSLASLNQVAADTKAVFVFVPARDGKQTSAIESRIEAAAKQARSQGSAVTAFVLSSDAEDYAGITKQAPAPCVLAMVKGAGATPVTGEITEAKLLAALVTASRASSCGPSGCGPSGCN